MDIDALLKEIETEDDWPEEASAMKQIEKSLKCVICHGTIKAAVMLSKCGHSFCSYCIRQYLYTDQACPLCRKPATESDIVRNISVIEIADVFREQRKELLKLCNHLFSPKPSIVPSHSGDDNYQHNVLQRESISSKRSSPSKSIGSESDGSHREVESIIDSDSDSVFELDSSYKRMKEEPSCMCECPICGEFFSQEIIENHASTCDGTIPSKPAKRFTGFVSSPTITKPLPNLCYRLMKTQEIKKQLQKYSLSTLGSRKVLIERHRQFTLRYNAELDNQHPMPVWKIAQIIMANEEHCKNRKNSVVCK